MKVLRTIALLALLIWGGTLAAQDEPSGTPTEICAAQQPADPETRQFAQAEQVIEAGVDYRAIFCTGAGAIYIDLWENYAPNTVNNFVFLAQEGYYNNSNFHRVIAEFMAQGGDPVGNPPGTGGPGYQFADEFSGFLTFDRTGLLAMANAGPGTNGSQFFITTAATDWLNYKHTIFGDVLEGYENVEGISLRDPETATDAGTTLDTIVIITDPTAVVTEFEEDIEVATAEDFQTALATLTTEDALPPELTVSETETGIFTSAEVVAKAPADVQEAYATFLEDHSHDYRVRMVIDNTSCSADFFFTALGYTVDAFATAEDATAALADPALVDINAASGYAASEEKPNVFTQAIPNCAEEAGTAGRLYLQRGRYVVVIEGIFADSVLAQAPVEVILGEPISQLFEQFLTTQFRSELR